MRMRVSGGWFSLRRREERRVLGLKPDEPEVALLPHLPSALAETQALGERFLGWPGLEEAEWRPGPRTGVWLAA